jgi:hypothetical protein
MQRLKESLILTALVFGLGALFLFPPLYPTLRPAPRAGFGLSDKTQASSWANRLGASWYLDWNARPIPAQSFPEYWPMVRVKNGQLEPAPEVIRFLARQYPGHTWLIGNEPDNIWQDNIDPETYARLYHDTYTLIKTTDPSARFAAGSLTLASPLRLRYLDRVLSAYQDTYGEPLPSDCWSLHGYVLREEKGGWGADIPPGFSETEGQLIEINQHGDLERFKQQIQAFRKWMSSHGYRSQPLVLTEFGILFPADLGYPPETIQAYLRDSFTWLEKARDSETGQPEDDNRLVQRWAWFSLADKTFPTANLADLKTNELTPIGRAYRSAVEKMLR